MIALNPSFASNIDFLIIDITSLILLHQGTFIFFQSEIILSHSYFLKILTPIESRIFIQILQKHRYSQN